MCGWRSPYGRTAATVACPGDRLRRPKPPRTVEDALAAAVSQFGAAVLPKFRQGYGQPEAQLREPLERLLSAIAKEMRLKLLTHGEAELRELKVRPDFAITIGAGVCGYVELKAPDKGVDPRAWPEKSRDRIQWEKLKNLPNLLYTNGNGWALYRDGEQVGQTAYLRGDVRESGHKLAPADGELLRVLADFLSWHPQTPRSPDHLVRSVAGLCRLLREEVREALALERAGNGGTRFAVLAQDWRDLLFPGLKDGEFADAYAQTVTFALLLARVERIDFDGHSVQHVAELLGKKHSLMGRALAVLTEGPALGKLQVTVDMLVRVIGAVRWELLDDGSEDAYLHLYERFLEVYDPELRRQSGSYYTPNDVVAFMTRFVEEILRDRLHLPSGYASAGVTVVDPAMGTGTFLINIIDRVAETIAREEGEGAVSTGLREFTERLVGFEKQTCPFAVAELRVYEAVRQHHRTEPPAKGMRLYVTDTLDNPWVEERQLGGVYEPIARSRREASKVKASERVRVVIGNPPYRERAHGLGGWVEQGDPAFGPRPLDAFRAKGLGKLEYVLSNLYVYFWRWATWKVFDAHPDAPEGVVAFITTSGYLTGPGFAGMREYLRRTADEGWIIDLSPEGHRPSVPTRVFPGVQHPLCIGVFARYGPPRPDTPATVHFVSVSGPREAKFRRLRELRLDDPAWQACASAWQAPLRPAGGAGWASFPLLADLLPWSLPGVKPNRTWVYAPDPDTLRARWARLVKAPASHKRALLKETRDRSIDSRVAQVEGLSAGSVPLREEAMPCPAPVRVAYRSFDRQWLIPDNRVVDFLRPELWRARSPRQVYLTEPRTEPPTAGPAVTFAADPPDMHHYRGRGGAVVPLYRDRQGLAPNAAPGLLRLLSTRLGVEVTCEDLLAYVAALTAHPGFTARFRQELAVPGVRVPLTADPALFAEAVGVGRRVVWLHTYGTRFTDPAEGRPAGPPRLPADRQPKVVKAIPDTEEGMPERISYDPGTATLHVGEGQVRPVPRRVWEYEVSGMRVVSRWFGYRKREPAGRRSTDLDHLTPTRWRHATTRELLDLLNVLGLLVELEPAQAGLLERACAGPLVTVTDLKQAGVLPVPSAARKPLPGGGEGTIF